MFKDLCPVCHYLTYKEEEGDYYGDGMKISPNEGYCSRCEYRYSEHVKHPEKEQVEKHIEWLKKISHIYKTDEFKQKISTVTSGKNNPMYGKPAPTGSGKGISGWYKTFYFRSLHELKFILVCERFKLSIASIEKLKIPYINYDGRERTYSPDFIVNEKFIVEIKPKKLFKTPSNLLKFNVAKEYCKKNNLKFKLMDLGIVYHDELQTMINNNKVKLNKK